MERDGIAVADDAALHIRIPLDWPADGETRIGYVSVLRLIECVRELHWRNDILPHQAESLIDSITRSLEADFTAPVLANAQIVGNYSVTWFRTRSYGLRVRLASESGQNLVRVDLSNVFVDSVSLRPSAPPTKVAEALKELVSEPREE